MAGESFDVDYVARLAHIELDDGEKAEFGRQLGNILAYMEKLKSLDVDGVEPTMHGHGRVNAFREDVVKPSMARDAALANAPERTDDEFRLPKIVEDA
ncbi:MAG: Asp-tRNA(Asn)/Glu-tRNA(Gln) amidotransferase subunit GatC [Kiritimatiellae bacterium]|nr:Asp-tRNA(Asn)/Glu-tRNA(Gln) amidotransferase subunit GatC [Kiritimatiellia bacterium]